MKRLALTLLALSFSSFAQAQDLLHRYSFTANADDTAGSANGTLEGGALVSGGNVALNGTSAYVSLPIGDTIASLTSSTFEAWVTRDTAANWARIFDFGTGEAANMFLTPQSSELGTPRYGITISGNFNEQRLNDTAAFSTGTETYIAVTIDAATNTGSFYINGILVATNTSMTLTPASLGTTTYNWLGRSVYPSDPYFDGSIDEFRIYSGALTAGQVSSSFAAGPDTVAVPEPSVSALLIGTGACIFTFARRRFRKG
jgi:hypothetical protein